MWTSAVCCLLLWQNEPHFVLMCIFWSVFQFHRASDKHPDLPALSLVFTEEPVSFCDARNHVHVPVRAGWVLQEFHARPLVRFLKPGTCWTIPLVLPPLPLFTFLLLYSPASVLHYICSFPFLLDISLMSSSSSLSMSSSPILPLHWALSITFIPRPESLYLLFLSSLRLPCLCLSFYPGGVVIGWWVGGRSSGAPPSCSRGLAHLPPPPAAIHLHKNTPTGEQQPTSAFQTDVHALALNSAHKT